MKTVLPVFSDKMEKTVAIYCDQKIKVNQIIVFIFLKPHSFTDTTTTTNVSAQNDIVLKMPASSL